MACPAGQSTEERTRNTIKRPGCAVALPAPAKAPGFPQQARPLDKLVPESKPARTCTSERGPGSVLTRCGGAATHSTMLPSGSSTAPEMCTQLHSLCSHHPCLPTLVLLSRARAHAGAPRTLANPARIVAREARSCGVERRFERIGPLRCLDTSIAIAAKSATAPMALAAPSRQRLARTAKQRRPTLRAALVAAQARWQPSLRAMQAPSPRLFPCCAVLGERAWIHQKRRRRRHRQSPMRHGT